MEENKLPILIDTDIGGDVDDALALALALNSPEFDIVGITNVYLANEWRANVTRNIVCDPEAARIVLESGAPIRMVGLDVTNQCRFAREDVDYIKGIGNPRTDLLGEMMELFIQNFGYLPILHDPLAMAALLWEDVLTFEEKKVLIETGGNHTRGLTIDCDWGEGVPVRAATAVRAEEFKKRLIERLVL